MKRRSFFGAMAAAGIGGKKVATDVLAEMAHGPIPMPSSLGSMSAQAAGMAIQGGGDYLGHLQSQAVKMAAMKAVGVPPLLREVMRQWAGQQQTNLDDINALVSVSVSAKKRMIREKLEDQMINDWFDRPARDLKRELFNKEFGVGL